MSEQIAFSELTTKMAPKPQLHTGPRENRSNTWDLGEPFDDLPEPFVDADDNTQWSPGEWYYDVNGNGTWDAGNGRYDATTVIWKAAHMIWSGQPWAADHDKASRLSTSPSFEAMSPGVGEGRTRGVGPDERDTHFLRGVDDAPVERQRIAGCAEDRGLIHEVPTRRGRESPTHVGETEPLVVSREVLPSTGAGHVSAGMEHVGLDQGRARVGNRVLASAIRVVRVRVRTNE